jgi:hypothetical protein
MVGSLPVGSLPRITRIESPFNSIVPGLQNIRRLYF